VGLPAVSSVTVMEAPLGPGWLGVKVTMIVQFTPAARLEPHVWLWLKSPPAARHRCSVLENSRY
jgi:hypothetical protein